MGIAKSLRSKVDRLVAAIEANKRLDRVAAPAADEVGKLTASPHVKNTLSGTWLGHPLHPMLTDIPIGAWFAASALDVLDGKRSAGASRSLVAIGVLSALPTAASGASDWADTYGPQRRVGLVHAMANTVGTLLQVSSWWLRGRGRRRLGAALSLGGLSVTLGSAYLGGTLTLVRGVGVNHTAFQHGTRKWTDVAAASEVTDSPMRVEVHGVPVMLVRLHGVVKALSATCTHASGPLDEGTVDAEGCVVCPWHGSRFRLLDGAAIGGPASVAEPAWDVQIENGRVSVRSSS